MLFENRTFVQDRIIRIYYQTTEATPTCHQFAFVVAKKKFGKATDRNRIKRLMREAVRLQKHQINSQKPLRIIVQYKAKSIVSIEEIQQSIYYLFSVLNESKN